MSARNFHSISMVAGVAAAALGCYMVSLRVAAERATLEQVETRIVIAQRDIRMLQTEVGTRGRLAQLEKWNVKVLALSAPEANQFLQGSFQLATLVRPQDRVVDPSAPVVLASAPQPPSPQARLQQADADIAAQPQGAAPRPGTSPSDMLHVASFKPADQSRSGKVADRPAPRPAAAGADAAPVRPAKTVSAGAIKPVSAKAVAVKSDSVKSVAPKAVPTKAVVAKSPSNSSITASRTSTKTAERPVQTRPAPAKVAVKVGKSKQ